MRLPLAALLVACSLNAYAAETPADRWNLSDLYASADAWSSDYAKLEAQIASFGRCKGRLGESAARLRSCMQLLDDMTRRYYRMAVYSQEAHDEDTGNSAALELDQKRQVIGARLDEATSFVRPEVLRVGKPRIDAFLASDRGLDTYRHPIDNMLRAAAHTLDAPGEAIVAAFALTDDNSREPYTILTNADIPWPKVTLSDGREVTVDPSSYTLYRQARDRADRKKVMDAFIGALKTYQRTLGSTYYGQLKRDAVITKVRKYDDSLTRALFADNVPRAVYDTLIAQTNASLPTLHRYFRLRAKIMGVEDLRPYDLFPPLVASDRRFPLDQAKRDVLAAVAPLGTEYVAMMRKGFDERWMDAYPRPRKLSGAHMAGYAYDVHPYVLMNYNEDYESVTTLAHEWGHALHSVLSNRAQPFALSDYATFVAEIASTVNEALLLEHMLKQAASDDERLLYLGEALEGLRGTFFVQSMFAEFERETHARVDRGEPLTGETLTRIYGDIMRRYYGDGQGAMKVDDLYTSGWTYIPHFYNAFYVYQYATSIAAAQSFASRILAGEPGVRERYLKLISAGGSDYPYTLVKQAGVDLATPEPYQALVRRMNAIMDEIERLVAKR